jgi:hypothetical protein
MPGNWSKMRKSFRLLPSHQRPSSQTIHFSPPRATPPQLHWPLLHPTHHHGWLISLLCPKSTSTWQSLRPRNIHANVQSVFRKKANFHDCDSLLAPFRRRCDNPRPKNYCLSGKGPASCNCHGWWPKEAPRTLPTEQDLRHVCRFNPECWLW